MTSENIVVSMVAIVASLVILVIVAMAIDYPKRIWHHLTGGNYKPVEEVASAYLLPAGVAAAGGMILVLGVIALVQPFDLGSVARAEATVVAENLLAGPTIQQEAAAEHDDGTADVGAMSRSDGLDLLKSKGCLVCHAFGNEGNLSGPGPQLEGLSKHSQIAATLTLNSENMKKWLANPPAVKPGTMMPNLGLSAVEIDKFTDFLMHQ